MSTIKKTINSQSALTDWCQDLVDFWMDHKYIQVTASDRRSITANAAIRVCYKQIQDCREDMTAKDVERHCKLYYGVPIRRANNEVEEFVYNRVFKGMTEEQKLKTMDCFSVTSVMSTAEANEMIECMMQDFPFIVIEPK
jgi:hypothetical protein